MANNYQVQTVTIGGIIFASDEDAGAVHWPYFKLAWGPDDVENIVDDAAGKRLPVLVGNFPATYPVTDNGDSLTVDGTVGVSSVPADPFGANADAASATGSISAKLRFIASTGIPITGTVTVGSHAVTNAGTFAVQETGTWVQVDDAAFTPAVSKIAMAGAEFDDTSPDPVDEGDGGALRMSARRELYTQLRDAAGNERGANVNASNQLLVAEASAASILTSAQLIDDIVYTDDTSTHATATSKGALLMAAAAPTDASVDANDIGAVAMTTTRRLHVSVQDVPADPFGLNADAASATGSISAKLRFIASTGIPVTSLPNVTLAAGTNTNEVVGDAAHDAGIAGNPVRIGARALSADYTAVSTGDTADLVASLTGKQLVLPYALPGASESYASPSAVTDTADDTPFAAAGAGVRHYITGVQVFNGHDTVGTEVVIKDGSTVLWRGWAEEKGGGCSAKFDPPLRGTANTAVNVANITTGSSTYFNLQGYTAGE